MFSPKTCNFAFYVISLIHLKSIFCVWCEVGMQFNFFCKERKNTPTTQWSAMPSLSYNKFAYIAWIYFWPFYFVPSVDLSMPMRIISLFQKLLTACYVECRESNYFWKAHSVQLNQKSISMLSTPVTMSGTTRSRKATPASLLPYRNSAWPNTGSLMTLWVQGLARRTCSVKKWKR